MLNRYYLEELEALAELGREFADAHPTVSRRLADKGSDPDVERLLEGVAFLTGRIRQKLDDEVPEFTHALLELLWPDALRPLPAATVVRFDAIPGAIQTVRRIPRGTPLASSRIEGTSCRFRTTAPVDLRPLDVAEVALERRGPASGALRVVLRVPDGIRLETLGFGALRLHLAGPPLAAQTLHMLLRTRLEDVVVTPLRRAGSSGEPPAARRLGARALVPVGYDDPTPAGPVPDEDRTDLYPAAAPGSAAFRLLREACALPAKFLFVDVTGLEFLAAERDAAGFQVEMLLAGKLPPDLQAGRDDVQVHCAPAVNLFESESETLRVAHDRAEYRLRAVAGAAEHHEIHTVLDVRCVEPGRSEHRTVPRLLDRSRVGAGGRGGAICWLPRVRAGVEGARSDVWLRLCYPDVLGDVPPPWAVTARLLCTNGEIASKLGRGDVATPAQGSPGFATFRNVSLVLPGAPAAISAGPPPAERADGNGVRTGHDVGASWRLLAHLATNNATVVSEDGSPDAVRRLLALHDVRALHDANARDVRDRTLAAILRLTSRPEDRLYRGTVVRGAAMELTLDERRFESLGEAYLTCEVLHRTFAHLATLNSHVRLRVTGALGGELFTFAPRTGGSAADAAASLGRQALL